MRGNTGTRLRVTRSEREVRKGSRKGVAKDQRTTRFLSLSAGSSVPLHSVQKLLPTLRVPDVLDPDIHPLLDVSVPHDLVDNNTDSARGDVVDNASSTVIMCKSHG